MQEPRLGDGNVKADRESPALAQLQCAQVEGPGTDSLSITGI